MERHSFGTCIMLQKELRARSSTSSERMNIFRSEHEGHNITKINTWFESCQDGIGKAGRQNDQLLIILFWTYLIVPVSEFRHFVVRNKEIWEKGDITNPPF